MAKAYSYDLRTRAIDMIENGSSVMAVKKLLKISRDTLYNWIKLKSITGDVVAGISGGHGHGHKVKDLEQFKNFINSNSGKTQAELAKLWITPVAPVTIGRYIQKIGFTFKKRPMGIVNAMKHPVKNL